MQCAPGHGGTQSSLAVFSGLVGQKLHHEHAADSDEVTEESPNHQTTSPMISTAKFISIHSQVVGTRTTAWKDKSAGAELDIPFDSSIGSEKAIL